MNEQIEGRARMLGASAVSVLSVQSLKAKSARLHEQVTAMLPSASSVVSFAAAFPKGAVHVLKDPEKGLPYYTRIAGIGARMVDEISIRLALVFEEEGFSAVPIFVCTPLEMKARFDLRGHVSQVELAALSGLGWIGKNGLLMTERNGPRIGVGTVLTDAPLPEKRCTAIEHCPDDCYICVEKCPARALDGSGRVERLACTAVQAIAPLSLLMIKEFPAKEFR